MFHMYSVVLQVLWQHTFNGRSIHITTVVCVYESYWSISTSIVVAHVSMLIISGRRFDLVLYRRKWKCTDMNDDAYLLQ
jgi:hypothetical protein